MYELAICMPSLEKSLFHLPICKQHCLLFVVEFRSSLHILGISPHIWSANVFSHPAGCLSTLLMVYFDSQKFSFFFYFLCLKSLSISRFFLVFFSSSFSTNLLKKPGHLSCSFSKPRTFWWDWTFLVSLYTFLWLPCFLQIGSLSQSRAVHTGGHNAHVYRKCEVPLRDADGKSYRASGKCETISSLDDQRCNSKSGIWRMDENFN